MSDFDSKLPVRTESNGDFVAKIADGTTPSQQLAVDAAGKVGVKLSDGAGTELTSTLNGAHQALDVNITGGQVDGDAFAYGSGAVTVSGGVYNDTGPTMTAGDLGALRLTAQRGLHTNLRDSAGAELVGQKAMAASVPVVIASDQTNIDINLHDGAGTAITSQASAGQQALDVGINVAGVQVDPRDIRTLVPTDEIKVRLNDATGAPFTPNNPLPVTMSDSPGLEVNDYNTAAAVAGGGTDNHDYTVTADKVLFLTQINSSASGKAKIEVQIETGEATDTFETRFVQFNSTADPNMEITLREPIQVAAAVRVRVIRSNRDNQSQDLYSTISGHEVDA